MPFLYVLVVLGGILNTIQSGDNATLNKALGQLIAAAFVVVAANVATYLLAIPFLGLAWPGAERIASVPWWGWLGGVLGGVYVLTVILAADKIGATAFTGLTITAALLTSVLLDHFGLVGFAVHAAGIGRVLGCLLMVGGLVLVCVF